MSYRQVKRLWQRYREAGRQGLKHGNAGRPSNRRKPLKLRRRVLHLIRKKYSGSEEERFGPTLAAEHLAEEDGIVLDHDTVRRWMLEEGPWSRQRKRRRHCQRRERRSHFGELVQLDGTFHDWLERRGPRAALWRWRMMPPARPRLGLAKESRSGRRWASSASGSRNTAYLGPYIPIGRTFPNENPRRPNSWGAGAGQLSANVIPRLSGTQFALNLSVNLSA